MNHIIISDEESPRYILSFDPATLNIGVACYDETDSQLVLLDSSSLNLLSEEKDIKTISSKLNIFINNIFKKFPKNLIKKVLIEKQLKRAGGKYNIACQNNLLIVIGLYSVFCLLQIETISIDCRSGIRFICESEGVELVTGRSQKKNKN